VEHQVNGSRTGKRLDTSDYSASPKVPIVLTSARHEECKSAFPPEYPPDSAVSPLRSGTPGLRPDSVPIRPHVGSSSVVQVHPAPLVGRCDRSSC
jgi:hypothetical protein